VTEGRVRLIPAAAIDAYVSLLTSEAQADTGGHAALTKTEAKAKLQQLLRDRDDGHVLGGQIYTVRDAVESWLAHGLTGRQESTVVNRTILARTHVIPALGARKLAQLSAEEVDQWLAAKAKTLSTETLHRRASPYAVRRRATW
jgi:Phage integrase, N-terminal SAM-like domain